ncbi:ABC transporter permease [Labrys monachus]|uniref:Spermidine/putrescine transport system permease protein n=1 Tax=Labrys monachus TaxID=217067 RepID=A0ABU0FPB2_9HYPH|nr:ABC transporter permease [Labrys monachus]MDQ0396301.1 spermidine/putrescine transport system permease protein [Labrys monachus]
MDRLLRRYGPGLTTLFVAMTAFWLLVLVVLPDIIMVDYSFRPLLPVAEAGGPKDVYTIANYATFFVSWLHVRVFLVTVLVSCVVTALCLAAAYPVAYFTAKSVSDSAAATLLGLLLVPMLVSELLRAFAWKIILDYKGVLNSLLGTEIRWLASYNGIIVGLAYTYILFMLLPVYNAIQSLDTSQIEAARDLGASRWRTHWRVVVPHAKPGIAAGCVMVFMLSAGSILVPNLLESPNSHWFTQVIQQWFFDSQDWHAGSAYAFLLLVLCTLFVALMLALFRVRLSGTAR